MSKRVAVRSNGDSIEKFAFLPSLASAAMGAVGRAAASKVGQTALGQGVKSMAGKLTESKVGQMAGKVAGKAKNVLGEDAGKKIGEAGAAMAQMQQQKQQAMQQQNQQMAEKAKAGSQISTGEPMNISWQMLKAWSFMPGFDLFDKKLIIEHARKNKKHVGRPNNHHHHKQFNHRYKQGQEMPKGFDYDATGLEPGDLAEALMDLQLQYNSNLLQDARTKGKVSGNNENGRPLEDNFPGITFPLLQTDEPIPSTHIPDKGSRATEYHPVFSAGHAHDEPSEHALLRLTSAMHSADGAKNRPHMPITHNPQMGSMSSSVHPITSEEAKNAFYLGDDISPDTNNKISQTARNRIAVTNEAERSHFGEFMQPIDLARMKEQGLSRSIKEKDAQSRVNQHLAGQNLNPLKYNSGNSLRQQYQNFLAQQAKEQANKETMNTEVPLHVGNGMYLWQNNYYEGSGQPPLPPEAKALIQTGEPMDMAWRLLKSQLLIH